MEQQSRTLLEYLRQSKKFGRVHHGFLNELEKIKALSSHVDKYSDYVEIAEGDVCWYIDHGDPLLVMMHPNLGNRIPARERVEKDLDKGNLITLAQAIQAGPNLKFVVELKTGTGDLTVAVEKMVECLEDNAPGKYLFDGFATHHLRTIKKVHSQSPVSLHSRLGVFGSFVLRTSYQVPCLGPIELGSGFFDAVTITYKYSMAGLLGHLGFSIDQVYGQIAAHDKVLLLGGVENDEAFQTARESMAIAAYQKYDKQKFGVAYAP